MKRIYILLTSLFLVSGIVVMDSCNDRRIRGCTDPDSINFDELAERDDGSCRFEGYAVIWYDRNASAGLINDGATALTFYLDNEVVGSSAASVYWAEEPDCGDNGSVSVTEDMGRNKRLDVQLSVRDQDGFEYWKTFIPFEANTCVIMQLTWESRKKK